MLWTDRLESGSSVSWSYHLPWSFYNPRLSSTSFTVAACSAYQAGQRKADWIHIFLYSYQSSVAVSAQEKKCKSFQKQTSWTINQSPSTKLTFSNASSYSFVHSNHLKFLQGPTVTCNFTVTCSPALVEWTLASKAVSQQVNANISILSVLGTQAPELWKHDKSSTTKRAIVSLSISKHAIKPSYMYT